MNFLSFNSLVIRERVTLLLTADNFDWSYVIRTIGISFINQWLRQKGQPKFWVMTVDANSISSHILDDRMPSAIKVRAKN